MSNEVKLADYPFHATDKIRFGDTDQQGHVNNAVFATFLETGRVELLLDGSLPELEPGTSLVIARIALDLRAEIRWPGTVGIGTRVAAVGRSSVRFEQAIFQNDRCAATAETVIVLMDEVTRKSTPLSDSVKSALQTLAGRSP